MTSLTPKGNHESPIVDSYVLTHNLFVFISLKVFCVYSSCQKQMYGKKKHLGKKEQQLLSSWLFSFEQVIKYPQLPSRIMKGNKHRGYDSLQVVFQFLKSSYFHMKIGDFHENRHFLYENQWFSWKLAVFIKSLFLVLSQIGLAVSLVQRGGVCEHWWPDFIWNLADFMCSFFNLVPE